MTTVILSTGVLFCTLKPRVWEFLCVPEEVLLDWLRVGFSFILVIYLVKVCVNMLPVPTERTKSSVAFSKRFFFFLQGKKW